jgi:GDP-L-fucose synthase
MCKILVAGATGMVGTSIVRRILSEYPVLNVRGTCHSSTPLFEHERLEYVQADLTNRGDCRAAVRDCDAVVMAAAYTGGAASARGEPHRQTTDNLVMDANLLDACHSEGVKRVAFISSATVYQDFDGLIAENRLDWSRDPHPAHFGVGWAKRSAEKLCQFWHQKYGMEIIVLRASNVIGPYVRFDPARSSFIPALIRKAVDAMDPFEIWGSPDVKRDVIYSEDFARAVVELLFLKRVKFDTFNVGSGKLISVGEAAELALASAGHRPAEILHKDSGPGTAKSRGLDCSKIRSTSGWEPQVSFEEGIRRLTLWWTLNRTWWEK